METDELRTVVIEALADAKARDVRTMDVRDMTTITDYMIVASGTSDRHVTSIAETLLDAARGLGVKPMGVEGERSGGWVLIDLRDIVVHVMLPAVRDFYNLEKLWDHTAEVTGGTRRLQT